LNRRSTFNYGRATLGLPQIATSQLTPNGTDVLTHHYDSWRTGANLSESVLTTKNVASQRFGKLFEREVDGDIYAQPLIKTGVVVPV
jgi:hypothetical protein